MKPRGGMMYSPGPMKDRVQTPDIGALEEQVGELERLADALGGIPDEELVGTLNRAVELLKEINARLEAGVEATSEGSREMGEIIAGLDLGPFDEALTELERQEREAGEP